MHSLYISCISLQLVHCNGFFTLLHQKSDKKSSVKNLNNKIEGKIFCLDCYQVKE